MPAPHISFHTGQPSFLEVHVTTSAPLDWLSSVRRSFTFLLECFHEPLQPDAASLRSYAIWLLYSLYPLPTQIKAGAVALETPPAANESEGCYFTPDGLAIRVQTIAPFTVLNMILRAIIVVGQHSGYRLADEVRVGYFELLNALTPSPADIIAVYLALPKSNQRYIETEQILEIQGYLTPRAALLCRVLKTPAERQTARWLKGLAALAAQGDISESALNWLLECVAVGFEACDEEVQVTE